MKRLICAAIAAIAVEAGSAAAADFPPSSFVGAPVGVYSWTGFYLGGHLGYQWGSTTLNSSDPSGVAGGFQGGYSLQSGQFLVGLELDLTLSGADGRFAPWLFVNPWFGTVRGRAGYALNNILFYGTGGFAYGNLRAEAFGTTETQTLTGWTLGGGMEVGLTRNWSARVEYLFVDLGGEPFTLTGKANGLSSNVFRLGANFRF